MWQINGKTHGSVMLVVFGCIDLQWLFPHAKFFWLITFTLYNKYFSPDESGLFYNDNHCIHITPVITEWFNEYKNHVNHMLWPSPVPSTVDQNIHEAYILYNHYLFGFLFAFCFIASDWRETRRLDKWSCKVNEHFPD